MQRLKQFLKQFQYLPRVFKLIWAASKGWTTAWFIILVIQSLIPFLTVVATRSFVNALVPVVASGLQPSQLNSIIVPFMILICLMLGGSITDSLIAWVRVSQAEIIRDYVSARIQEQTSRLDMSYYEDNKYYDLIYRVREEARHHPLMLLENTGMMIKSLISTMTLGLLLISYGWWLLPLLVATAVPALWTVLRFNQRLDQWRRANTVRERRSFYYDSMLTERLPAAEMRAFNLSSYYLRVYQELRLELRNERLHLWRRKIIVDLLVNLFGMGVAAGVIVWMGLRVLHGSGTLGDLLALYQIFSNVQTAFGSLSTQAGGVYQSTLFLEDLFVFFDLQPRLEDQGTQITPPLLHEIRFEHVTFHYPGSERNAIEDFSATIPAGKVIALVGENGEGKTTLTKLISRFFDPDSGQVLWDGIDLRDLSVVSLRREIAMLFQSPYYYPESVLNNVTVGDLDAHPSMEEVIAASRAAGVYDIIMKLPQQYGTILGKWFGGEELSTGQWQRLALARALVRKASLVMLDEPTSAMDAWAEAQWLQNIRAIARDRTMMIITHRFTTAMHADLVLVIQNSQIVERGTHAELLAQGGRYAQSWHAQMSEANHMKP